jgi:predicted nucleotidyltransferase
MKSVALREKDLEVLRGIARRFPVVREVRIFGSRATGEARRASDIDLAISAPTASAAEWSDICEALEEAPLIYELDVVRPERMADERLMEKIERDGVLVYPVDEGMGN